MSCLGCREAGAVVQGIHPMIHTTVVAAYIAAVRHTNEKDARLSAFRIYMPRMLPEFR